jgi:hypothetical protein
LRNIAATAPRSPTSRRLTEMADGLERRAADLEREQDVIDAAIAERMRNQSGRPDECR